MLLQWAKWLDGIRYPPVQCRLLQSSCTKQPVAVNGAGIHCRDICWLRKHVLSVFPPVHDLKASFLSLSLLFVRVQLPELLWRPGFQACQSPSTRPRPRRGACLSEPGELMPAGGCMAAAEASLLFLCSPLRSHVQLPAEQIPAPPFASSL